MGAAEVIAKAIEKLERLRDNAAEGPWMGWRQYNPLRGHLYGVENSGGRPIADKVASAEDAELIEVLHRTIDAQLVILKDARRTLLYASPPGTVVGVFAESAVHNAEALAAGILGES